MARRSVDLQGGPVEYEWFGPTVADAARPVAILLHEGLGCIDLWRDFPERLAEALECRVLVYSRHGYGGSGPCDLPRPVTYMHHEAQVVLPELLGALGVDRYLLVGHSDGGSIALIHGGGSADPGLVGIVMLAAHIFNEPINQIEITRARQAYEAGGLKDALAKYHGANTECAFRGWSEAWLSDAFKGWNLESFLPRIQVPCLVMQGISDAYGTEEQVQGIEAGLTVPNTIIMLPDCGHAIHRDQPDRLLGAIRDFASGLKGMQN